MTRIIAASLLLLSSSAFAKAPDLSNIGTQPNRDEGIAMVENAVRAELKDPDSAKFNWPNSFVPGWYQIPFSRKYVGWITCGTVNAKNGYGGYAGSTAVIGVINNGSVTRVDVDMPSAYGSGLISEYCRKIGVPAGD